MSKHTTIDEVRDSRFQEGQLIESIFFSDKGVIAIGKYGCQSIKVVMENGQRAAVPWFLVKYDDKPPQKYNAALVEGVCLLGTDESITGLDAVERVMGLPVIDNFPEKLRLRDTELHDDQGGLGQRIFTTAGAGYVKQEYVRADLYDNSQAQLDAVKENANASYHRAELLSDERRKINVWAQSKVNSHREIVRKIRAILEKE